jgi:hypothetical protein
VDILVQCRSTPFDEVASDFRCPQCKATKKRFARYDADSGKKVRQPCPVPNLEQTMSTDANVCVFPLCCASRVFWQCQSVLQILQVGGVEGTVATIATVTVGLAGLGVLLYLGLNV